MAPLTQAWVTYATDDVTFVQSLVLARSLRKVYTTRKIVIIVTNNISREKRSLLEKEFDAVFLVDNGSALSSAISLDLLALLYGWKLILFQKCVFIGSQNIVLKNCDNLFNSPSGPNGVSGFPREPNSGFETSIFVFSPSIKTFFEITRLAESNGMFTKDDHSKLLNMYWTKWNNLHSSEEKVWKNCVKVIPRSSSGELLHGVSNYDHQKIIIYIGTIMNNLMQEIFDSSQSAENSVLHPRENLFDAWLDVFHNEVFPNLQKSGININSCVGNLKNCLRQFPISNSSEVSTLEKLAEDGYDYLNEAIAVVGMSCKFPGANNPEEFWDVLIQERDEITTVPEKRLNFGWDNSDMDTKGGFLKTHIDEFDGKFFGISPREAALMDPQQRILLETSWQALEDAGIDPTSLKGSQTGVFMGAWSLGYERFLKERCEDEDTNFQRVYLGNSYSSTSARVSFHLGLNGPNIATESGCSSSMISIHLACESLRRGDCAAALAGGVNLLVYPYKVTGAEHILSPDGHCKTFDEKADGFVRAEGCGVLVLKKYSEAIKDGDRVISLIRGSAVSQEGTTSSFGTPTKLCQELAVRGAIKNARISPAEVTYVEAHGTGTAVGDPIEIAAIGAGYKQTDRKDPLYIGSVKTNIGHSESAAGVAGCIKVILSLQHGIIPAHINLNNLNSLIDLKSIPADIPQKSVSWKRPKDKGVRIAGVSSFGISGSNVHMIIQEPLFSKSVEGKGGCTKSTADRSRHILTISAKSGNALKELTISYKNYLSENPNSCMADICYTSNIGRSHFPNRLAIVGNSNEDFLNKLSKQSNLATTNCPDNSSPEKHDTPKIAFLFTGQGSQYSGMGKELYRTHSIFRYAINHCADIVQSNFGICLLNIIFETNDSELDQTIYSQMTIFCIEYALCQLWLSFGIKPDCVLGHSLGEFAAATAAGIISLDDALKLVHKRSRLIQSLPEGGMMAVMGNVRCIKNHVNAFNNNNSNNLWLDVAVINSDEEVVVSGRPNVLEIFDAICQKNNLKTKRLAASQAFHSRDVELILKEYGDVASTIKYNYSNCKYISGTTGNLLCNDNGISSLYWQNHAKSTVNFNAAVKTLCKEDCNVFIEVGPHPVLLALALSNMPMENITSNLIWLPSMRKGEDNWVTLLESLRKMYVKGYEIDWQGLHSSSVSRCKRNKVSLPKYPFQRQSYWFEANKYSDSIYSTKNILHPLIGRKLSLHNSENIFHHSLSLKKLAFLEQHKVASKIIIPGACFMEMILTAGFATMHSNIKNGLPEPVTPLIVENFSIEAPMELKEGNSVNVQTIVAKSDTEEENFSSPHFTVSIHRKIVEEGTKITTWKRHAIGTFSVNYSSNTEEMQINLREIQNRCSFENSTDSFYEEFSKIGIDFGPVFRSVRKIWESGNEMLAEIPIPKDAGKLETFLCHPILIDALIQCSGFGFKNRKGLCLPIGMKKFVWFSRKVCPCYYAHAKLIDGKIESIRLYDDTGNLLVLAEGIQIVQCSIASFLKALHVENKLPGMFTEVWYPNDKSSNIQVDLSNGLKPQDVENRLGSALQKLAEEEEEFRVTSRAIDKISGLYILKILKEVGWRPFLGEILSVRDFLTTHIISLSLETLLVRFFTSLTEDGFLECEMDPICFQRQWKVVRLPEDNELKENFLENQILSVEHPKAAEMFQICLPCIKILPSVLQGKESMLTVLFSDEQETSIAERLYSESDFIVKSNEILGKCVEEIAKDIILRNSQGGHILKVLEIGAGTGSTSKYVFSALENSKIEFEYTYTDISPILISKASKKFENLGNAIQYKTLNIENDPKPQGFVPHSFDMIIASNVIHATEDLVTSIKNSRHLLAPHGYMVLLEMLQPLRIIDFVFGPVDGFVRFKDLNIRKDSPIVSGHVWESLMLENGFEYVSTMHTSGTKAGVIVGKATEEDTTYNGPALEIVKNVWSVFSTKDTFSNLACDSLSKLGKTVSIVECSLKFEAVNENDFFVNPTNKESFDKMFEYFSNRKGTMNLEGIIFNWGLYSKDNEQEMLQGLLYLAQNIVSIEGILPKLFIFTQGVISVTDDDKVIAPAAGSLYGFINSLKNEYLNLQCYCVDLDPTKPTISCSEFNKLLWGYHNYNLLAIRNNVFYSPRAKKISNPSFSLPLKNPNCQRFKIILPESNSISDLTLGPAEKFQLLDTQIEIAVKATGLNFRDILIIMKPDGYHSFFDTEIGTDFAGVVLSVGSKVTKFAPGDEIFGANFRGSLSSHAIVQSELCCLKPGHNTFLECATLPSVYYTAYHCLFNIAKLTNKDVVLIHVASGGVGLIAIQLAQTIGAKIIATAGSPRKRAYLRLLGIQHVFHSRDTSYADEIEKLKNNGVDGVDVVINSLTSPGFKEASLRVCKTNARFVEIGKINIWQPEDVRVLRKDVDYTIVNLENVSLEVMTEMVEKLETDLLNGNIKALPFTRFELPDIKEALNYFRKAHHIGKVVVAIPDSKFINGGFEFVETLFTSESSYLITGGLGGLGLEVAKWMAKSGAKNIILASRRYPDEKTLEMIQSIINLGVNVITKQVDISNFSQCKQLLEDCAKIFPPLRGVMHAAGSLSDATILNQTWEKFEAVLNAKVNGAWNLHLLTQQYPLEHFILFSSMACIFGTMGQSNHASANYFMDSLARYRHSLGLPAQTINWGAWSDIGAAASLDVLKYGSYFSPAQGIEALRDTLISKRVKTLVADIDYNAVIQIPTLFNEYIKDVAQLNIALPDDKVSNIDSKAFWDSLKDLTLEARIPIVQSHIESIVREILKLSDSDKIDYLEKFSDLGMDSLMAVELKNKLQMLIGKGIVLNASTMLDHPNLKSLGEYIASITLESSLISGENVSNHTGINTHDIQLVKEDCRLPLHIKGIGTSCKKPFQTVFLTGATGNLGMHLLKNLVGFNKNLKIYCLIRHKTESGARGRMVEAFQRNNLLSETFTGNGSLKNIVFLPGDLTEEFFGLEKHVYDDLSENVDAIFHFASKINHLESYKKYEKIRNDIRSVNVFGLIRILEFASTTKSKHLFWPTSFSAITNSGENDEIRPETIKLGFGLTKFVCEKLIQQAMAKGIQCTVFRLCSLIGNSQTGQFHHEKNHIISFSFACMKLGIYPESVKGWHVLPVDTAADIILRLSFHDQISSGMHTICSPKLFTKEDMQNLCHEKGIPLKILPSEEFSNQFHKNLENTMFNTFSSLYPNFEDFLALLTLHSENSLLPASSLYLEGNEVGITKYEQDEMVNLLIPNFAEILPQPIDTLRRHVQYAISNNVLNNLIA